MHPRLLPIFALVTVPSLLYTGCAPLSTAETSGPGPFSNGNAQLAAANINRASTAATGERFATGAPVAATTVEITAIIAKHQASIRQREIAQQRAKAAYRKIVARHEASVKATAAAPAQPKPGVKTATGHPPKAGAELADVRKPHPYRIPRYIAVETEKDAKDAPGTKKAVMIWDTQAQEIVGNNVYDIGTPPAVGANSRFETFSAEYVGAGL